MKFRTVRVVLLLIAAIIMAVGCERKVVNESGGELKADASACFSCHSDQDRDLRAAALQWETSKHASGDNVDRNRHNGYGSCEGCHTSEGFLAKLEGESASGDYFTPFECFTCHAPHTNTSLEVRVQEAVSIANGATFDKGSANLCASCHQGRRNVDTYVVDDVELSEHWGPHHSNQSDMLIGSNAYEYGLEIDNSAHTNVATEGCVMCHMSASGDITLGGHSWRMHDEQKDHYNMTGCNVASCHNGEFEEGFEKEADDDYDWDGTTESVQAEIEGLLDSLAILLEEGGLIEDGEPLEVTTSADSAGAVFNYLFVHEDRSEGVHNTEYAVGILQAAIHYMATGDPEGMPAGNKKRNFADYR